MSNRWPRVQLGEVTINHDARRVPVRESDRKPGPYPYYGASGVVDYVDEYLFEGLHLLIAEDGENLRTRKTPVAFLADGRFWVNNHAHIVTGNERADTRYLSYALAIADISGYLTGSAMPKLSQRSLNAIELPLPPLEVQLRIAETLGSLDEKIEQNRRTDRILDGLAQAMFRAWFVDFEPVKAKMAGRTGFPGMSAEAFAALPERMAESAIGPVPEGWAVRPLSEVCHIVGGGTPKRSEAEYWGGSIPWYSVKDAPPNGMPWVYVTEEQITQAGLDGSAATVVPVGCTIISARGTVGRLALAGRPMAFNQSCYGLLPSDRASYHHLHMLIRQVVGELQRRTHGSVFDTISRQTFEVVNVVCPPYLLLRQFEQSVAPLFDLLLTSLKESYKLAEIRNYLLPGLLSGRVQVGNVD